jgi:hypothetical protein
MNTQAILAKVAKGMKLTDEEVKHLTAAATKPERKITLKVSTKGAVSLYGLGRFPVTLYGAQWEKVLAMGPEIRAFIAANAATLSQSADDKRNNAPAAPAAAPAAK